MHDVGKFTEENCVLLLEVAGVAYVLDCCETPFVHLSKPFLTLASKRFLKLYSLKVFRQFLKQKKISDSYHSNDFMLI